jgi:hypothetical protein
MRKISGSVTPRAGRWLKPSGVQVTTLLSLQVRLLCLLFQLEGGIEGRSEKGILVPTVLEVLSSGLFGFI